MTESRCFEFDVQDARGGRFACVAPSLTSARATARALGHRRVLLRREREPVGRERDDDAAWEALADPLLGESWMPWLVAVVEALERVFAAPALAVRLVPQATMAADEARERGHVACACASMTRAAVDRDPALHPVDDAVVHVVPQAVACAVTTPDGGWELRLDVDERLPHAAGRLACATLLGWRRPGEGACDLHATSLRLAVEPPATSSFAVAHRLLVALRFVADLRLGDDVSCTVVAHGAPS